MRNHLQWNYHNENPFPDALDRQIRNPVRFCSLFFGMPNENGEFLYFMHWNRPEYHPYRVNFIAFVVIMETMAACSVWPVCLLSLTLCAARCFITKLWHSFIFHWVQCGWRALFFFKWFSDQLQKKCSRLDNCYIHTYTHTHTHEMYKSKRKKKTRQIKLN